MRRFLLPLSLILVALAAFGSWMLGARPGGAGRAPLDSPAAPAAVALNAPRLDSADETWHLSLPPPVAATERRHARRPEVATEGPDWSALRLGVAAVASPAPVAVAAATRPAELEIAMSEHERRALIASAREPESLGPPRGYRPGIAVIIPGGSSSDGVCR